MVRKRVEKGKNNNKEEVLVTAIADSQNSFLRYFC